MIEKETSMRVLQVGLSYNPGGIESFVMNYYRQISREGVQFDFVSMFPKLAYEDEILQMGGRVYHTVDARKYPLKFRKQLMEILTNEKYMAVHVNMLSAANIVPLIVAKKTGIPKVIAHSHNSSSPGIIRNVLHYVNKHLIPRYATDYFACSNVAGQWLFDEKLLQSSEFHVVHNALDIKKFLYSEPESVNIRKELAIEEKFVIGHIGRFEEQKNHKFLLEIFHEVVKKRDDAVLILVGNGELLEESRRVVKVYGIEDKVKFLGIRNDVERIWKAIDLFLFPSLFEGLPIVALEAQAAGVYSILSDAITQEVKITDNVKFVSLNKGKEYWVQQILQCADYQRNDVQNAIILEQFKKAGYDICEEAKRLKKYYLT